MDGSRYCGLEGSAALIGRALRNSVVAIAELELNNVADGSSHNIGNICVLRSSNHYRYDLVGPLDFRNDVTAYDKSPPRSRDSIRGNNLNLWVCAYGCPQQTDDSDEKHIRLYASVSE